jgi:predicted nucleic acid-binding protein
MWCGRGCWRRSIIRSILGLIAVAVLRCVIDSMVFDAIAAEPQLLARVDRLTSAGRLELLAATETIAEIAATPDRAHRRRLQRVRVLVVPPPDPDGDPTLLARLRRSTGVSDDDASIALTAAAQGVPLVTEDRDLRLAVAAHLPDLPLWRWAPDLRPRIAALEHEQPTAMPQAGPSPGGDDFRRARRS